VPDVAPPSESLGWLAAFGPASQIAVDDVIWRGRALGRLSGTLTVLNDKLAIDDARLVSDTHDARAELRCETGLRLCRLSFTLESRDVAASLEDFGFSADVAASQGSLSGDVEWRPGHPEPWLASLGGTLSLRLTDGTTRQGELGAQRFPLLAVPALVAQLDPPGGMSPLRAPTGGLHFARLDADFELSAGQATTSSLYFDGDTQILARGRTSLLAQNYDQEVWVLRGQERLPAAVRRFGAVPNVAAVWLSMRELFTGSGEPDRANAVLRLQGSWDDPIVVAAD
jgi:uncharacterized protein YhdP